MHSVWPAMDMHEMSDVNEPSLVLHERYAPPWLPNPQWNSIEEDLYPSLTKVVNDDKDEEAC